MTPRDVVRDLIVDIGMSEGNDTDFYLKKGFRVVGVEADARMQDALATRFAEAVAAGRLVILRGAAWDRGGEEVTFLAQDRHQGGSHVLADGAVERSGGATVAVPTFDWNDIIAVMGVPYYCKIDIEGGEEKILNSITEVGALPTFCSVEAHNFGPIELLYRAGYRRFKLVNQTMHQSFRQPSPPLEGTLVANHKFVHSSGLFGRELPGRRWLDFRETAVTFEAIQRVKALGTALGGWFDCHATIAEPGA